MPKGIYPRIPGRPRPHARKRVVVSCLNCNSPVSAAPSEKRKYCSRACNVTHYRGVNHAQFMPEGRIISGGYRSIGGKQVHRQKAETALGRKLRRDEVVHHIDGDKSNNENSNLLICSLAYHQWLHMEMSLRYAKEHFGKK